MSYWPSVAGALGLLSLPFMHWFVLDRGMAVSGRFSMLIDRLRSGPKPAEPAPNADQAELIAALRAMTAEEFGADSLDAMPVVDAQGLPAFLTPPEQEGAPTHVMFLVGLILGGTISVLLGSGLVPTAGLHSAIFPQIFGDSPIARTAVLFAGGLLIGAGTRMAGGCTSGHGLCGVSQLQPGSVLATASFFGAGVVLSLALGALV
jgi:hypothetical protein